ncbi:MAG TPA: hypothetical protein VNF29_12670 [Candidatus Binataceae bacterium]|nr:hypothetical protein [Candidatus Binataceae bacterium]
MDDLDIETKVIGIVAPTTSMWAVFAAEEGDNEEIWTERVHLWAHTRAALPRDRAAEEEFLGNEVPPARCKIQGMVLCEGDLALVSDTGWLLLGYSEDEKPRTEDWADRIKFKRRLFAREMRQMDEMSGKGAT